MSRLARLAALALLGAGCTADLCPKVARLPGPADVLVLGDSILAWGHARCQSVGDQLALGRGRAVLHAALNGTELLRAGDFGPPITAQYQPGRWAWVVIDGGGNDLNNRCQCGDCAAVLDALVTADGRGGAMAALVDRALGDGARVALVGYYTPPRDAGYGFSRCQAPMAELRARYRKLAGLRPGVRFVDFAEAVSPEATPEAFDDDHLHPSPKGAALLGAQLARALAAP